MTVIVKNKICIHKDLSFKCFKSKITQKVNKGKAYKKDLNRELITAKNKLSMDLFSK